METESPRRAKGPGPDVHRGPWTFFPPHRSGRSHDTTSGWDTQGFPRTVPSSFQAPPPLGMLASRFVRTRRCRGARRTGSVAGPGPITSALACRNWRAVLAKGSTDSAVSGTARAGPAACSARFGSGGRCGPWQVASSAGRDSSVLMVVRPLGLRVRERGRSRLGVASRTLRRSPTRPQVARRCHR